VVLCANRMASTWRGEAITVYRKAFGISACRLVQWCYGRGDGLLWCQNAICWCRRSFRRGGEVACIAGRRSGCTMAHRAAVHRAAADGFMPTLYRAGFFLGPVRDQAHRDLAGRLVFSLTVAAMQQSRQRNVRARWPVRGSLCEFYCLCLFRNSLAAKRKRSGGVSGSAASRHVDSRSVNVRRHRIRCFAWFVARRNGCFGYSRTKCAFRR